MTLWQLLIIAETRSASIFQGITLDRRTYSFLRNLANVKFARKKCDIVHSTVICSVFVCVIDLQSIYVFNLYS